MPARWMKFGRETLEGLIVEIWQIQLSNSSILDITTYMHQAKSKVFTLEEKLFSKLTKSLLIRVQTSLYARPYELRDYIS